MSTKFEQAQGGPSTFKLPESLSEMAERYLEAEIVEGRLPPGTRLNPEDIARQLNISKSPVREAIILLQRDGLVARKPRSIFVVSEIKLRDLQEIYPIRASLNALAVMTILQSTSAAAIVEKLAGHLVEMRSKAEAEDIVGYFHLSGEFYDSLILSCSNKRLWSIWNRLSKPILRFRFLVMSQPGHIERSYADHIRLIAAMRAGNIEEAMQCTREIIYSALADLTIILESNKETSGES